MIVGSKADISIYSIFFLNIRPGDMYPTVVHILISVLALRKVYRTIVRQIVTINYIAGSSLTGSLTVLVTITHIIYNRLKHNHFN